GARLRDRRPHPRARRRQRTRLRGRAPPPRLDRPRDPRRGVRGGGRRAARRGERDDEARRRAGTARNQPGPVTGDLRHRLPPSAAGYLRRGRSLPCRSRGHTPGGRLVLATAPEAPPGVGGLVVEEGSALLERAQRRVVADRLPERGEEGVVVEI